MRGLLNILIKELLQLRRDPKILLIYLSGFIFPIQNMPRVFQWLTYLIPLRYYVTILRGVFLKGVGLGVLWPQGLMLVILGTTILILARLRFRKRLG
mgnify:CR=1 FL=1